MKKSILLFACLLVACSSSLLAQFSIGLEAGYNKNYIISNLGYRAFTKYEPLEGFNIGIPVKYDFNSWFALQADPQFMRKGYKLNRTEYFEGVFQNYQNHYFKLPLMAHFSFGGSNLKGFLNLGAYAGYWASGKIKGKQWNIFGGPPSIPLKGDKIFDDEVAAEYEENYTFDKRRDRRIELGTLIGIGMSYRLNNQYQVFGEGRYYRALTDHQKRYMLNQIPQYNDSFTLQVGVLYRLGK